MTVEAVSKSGESKADDDEKSRTNALKTSLGDKINPTKRSIRTVGLAVVTKLAASLCRDAGEGSVAAFVELAGSAAAVVVALPLLDMVLKLVEDLL